VKIALDPTPFHATHSLLEFPRLVKDLGYDYLQMTPHPDFIPFFNHPKADDDLVARLGAACKAAVRNWKRIIRIAVDLGVQQLNTEFQGRPELAEESERAFYRSMEELLPIIEREGLHVAIDPHPDDFVERGLDAWRVIRGANSKNLGMVYVACHTFHMEDEPLEIMRAAGDRIRVAHVADSMDHHRSNGLRYITNPPGSPARVHQHLKIGDGDVDWQEFFGGLNEIGFLDSEDTVLVSSVFAENEDASAVSRYQLDTMTDMVDAARQGNMPTNHQ